MFVAAMLYDWTNKFSLSYTVERSADMLKNLSFSQASLAVLVAVILIAMSAGRTLTILYEAYVTGSSSRRVNPEIFTRCN